MLHRYFVTLSYNGKFFHGWQVQPNADSVQQRLSEALQILLKREICVQGAGRTDTGVHANFFVAHFDIIDEIKDTEKFTKNLNGILNHYISIFDVFEVHTTMHSRFSALSRTYKYYIHSVKNSFLNDFSYWFKYPLDVEKMNQACDILKSYEDFKSFEKAHSDAKTSICKISEAFWTKTENQYIFTIKADRFLRNMVRSIVGTMIEIGQNKITIEDFKKIIEAKDRNYSGKSVDAQGLFLTDIEYPEQVNKLLEKSRNLAKYIIAE